MHFLLPPSSTRIKNLVLSLDAFGTIFHPRRPIAQQYISAAQAHGLKIDWKDEGRVLAEFKGAFKSMSQEFPNYGKGKDMRPEGWWAEVIKRTFQPFVSQVNSSPLNHDAHLVLSLLQTFSNDKGYALYPDAHSLFRALPLYKDDTMDPKLKHPRPELESFKPYERTVVGIITNSDTRVLQVLRHLQLLTSQEEQMMPRADISIQQPSRQGYDGGIEQNPELNSFPRISFTVLSYDVGAEKPSREIFDAARKLALRSSGLEESETQFVHVGDDFEKDVMGARQAGWDAILLDRDGTGGKGARVVDDDNKGFVKGDLDGSGRGIDIRVIRGLNELIGEPLSE